MRLRPGNLVDFRPTALDRYLELEWAAGERAFQMQGVDPAHQRQIGSRSHAGRTVDANPAYPRDRRLPATRQIVMAFNPRFALSRMHVELLYRLDDRLPAFHRCDGRFRLEGRRAVPPWTSCCLSG